MEKIHVTAKELRRRLAEVLSATEYGGKVYVVTKNGRPVAQIMPLQDSGEATPKRKSRT